MIRVYNGDEDDLEVCPLGDQDLCALMAAALHSHQERGGALVILVLEDVDQPGLAELLLHLLDDHLDQHGLPQGARLVQSALTLLVFCHQVCPNLDKAPITRQLIQKKNFGINVTQTWRIQMIRRCTQDVTV